MKEDNIGWGAIHHSRGVHGGAHDSKESTAANRGGKRGPQMKGTTAAGGIKVARDRPPTI